MRIDVERSLSISAVIFCLRWPSRGEQSLPLPRRSGALPVLKGPEKCLETATALATTRRYDHPSGTLPLIRSGRGLDRTDRCLGTSHSTRCPDDLWRARDGENASSFAADGAAPARISGRKTTRTRLTILSRNCLVWHFSRRREAVDSRLVASACGAGLSVNAALRLHRRAPGLRTRPRRRCACACGGDRLGRLPGADAGFARVEPTGQPPYASREPANARALLRRRHRR